MLSGYEPNLVCVSAGWADLVHLVGCVKAMHIEPK